MAYPEQSSRGCVDHNDPDIRRKRSEARKGKKHTPEWVALVTEFHRGRKRSPEMSARISKALTGRKLSEEHRAKCSRRMKGKLSPRKGVTLLAEQKDKLRSAKLGTKHSDSTRRKMSERRAGKKYPIVECPHCGKSGASPSMHQWHFDNCKYILAVRFRSEADRRNAW